MKTCTKCLTAFETSFFSRDKTGKDGLSTRCKSCCNAREKIRYEKNSDQIKKVVSIYAAKNVEKIASYKRSHYQKNREELSEKSAIYYLEKAEVVKARSKEWKKNNPVQYALNQRSIQATRRARKRGADGRYTAMDIARILDLQRWRCTACKTSLRSGYHADHIQALSRGGSNWPSNIQCLCPSCNQKKSAKDPIKFAQQIGRLL